MWDVSCVILETKFVELVLIPEVHHFQCCPGSTLYIVLVTEEEAKDPNVIV